MHDSSTKTDMVRLVTICRELMRGVPTAPSFVGRYNLEIDMIYSKVKVKFVARLVPRVWVRSRLRWNLYCCTSHEVVGQQEQKHLFWMGCVIQKVIHGGGLVMDAYARIFPAGKALHAIVTAQMVFLM